MTMPFKDLKINANDECFIDSDAESTLILLLNSLPDHAPVPPEVSVTNHAILAQFCKDHNVGLVVVGPEVPLAAGKSSSSL